MIEDIDNIKKEITYFQTKVDKIFVPKSVIFILIRKK
jgi:hypothetical protein